MATSLLLLSWLTVAVGADDASTTDQPAIDPPAEVSAARLCAEAAQGREVDVCVRLAAEHPDQADEVAAALRAHVDRSAEHDRALLSALLLLLSEETGVEGARKLGELHDPRAVPPLEHAGEHRRIEVAVAAARALASYPRGLDPLTRWIRADDLPVEVRIASARALGDLGAQEGADALLTALRRRGNPPALREAMVATLQERFPDRLDELDHQVTRDGTVWLIAAGAHGLGQGLGMAGFLGRGDLAALGVATGMVAGGTAGWVAGRAWPMEASDAAFLTTTGVAGQIGGTLIGAAAGASTGGAPGTRPATTGAWVGGAAGAAVGYGSGYLLRRAHPGSIADSIEASLFSGATALAVGTGVTFAYGWRADFGAESTPPLATGLGFLGGIAAGHALAPHIDVTAQDAWMLGLASAYGLTAGALVPVSERRGLPWTGLGLGAMAGYGLAGVAEPPPDVTLGAASGLAYGGVLGAGLGMLLRPDADEVGDATRVGALTAGTLGMAGGAFAAWRNPEPINGDDLLFTSLVTAWGTWNSIGWYTEGPQPPPSMDGWFLVVPAAAGAGAAAASPILDVPANWSFSGLSMGLWGAYLGATIGELGGLRGDPVLRYSLIGSDIGLAAGFILSVPPIGMPILVLGLADAGGVLGGSLFALGTSLFVDPNAPGGIDTILAASLVGVAGGFVGGALLGRSLYRSGATRDVAFRVPGSEHARWAVTPTALPREGGPAWGATVQVAGW